MHCKSFPKWLNDRFNHLGDFNGQADILRSFVFEWTNFQIKCSFFSTVNFIEHHIFKFRGERICQ